MAEQEAISNPGFRSDAKSGVGGSIPHSPVGTALEETAAMVAVLALMQTETSLDTEPPSMSAWARAGRREAVRPWKKQP